MKKYILLPLIGASLIACRLDDNIDPNSAGADEVTPALRLAGASTTAYAVQASSMNGLGNAWMNAWAGNFAQFGNPFTIESNLNITTSFRQTIFTEMYKAVTRFERIIDFPDAKAKYPNYVAIAKIQKAYYMQYIVDLYGDVPYTEAFKENEGKTPHYDDDVTVYKGLVDEVFEAIQLINNSNKDIFAVSEASDPIYHGSMTNWKSFANTVLLKYVIHLSGTTNAEGIALRNKIIDRLAGASYVTNDVTINPGYNNNSADGQNPLYNSFGRGTYDGKINTQGYQLMTASDHILKTLQGDPSKITAGVSDPRISQMFTTGKKYDGTANGGATGYYGFPQGMNIEDYKAYMGYPASALKPANKNFSLLGGMFYSFPAGASSDGYLMMKSEVEFLQAEAALRYPATFSSAQQHFTNGVTASFAFYDMAGSAAAYLTAINNKPKVGWTGNMTQDIAAIQYQRWIALTNYNGAEAYINYLRTGYPETPLATTAAQPNKPYRLMYPALEYSTNAANVPSVTQAQVFSKNETTPFIYR
ncbi:MAG: SusD/RagB family nutrient-binding outer membrane lipoprotein [Chryseobacterium sp.]|nr:MAG: SusD/RagB family nutrient-binding outer membrane lipoprotein [Chryseobacterium sp.]